MKTAELYTTSEIQAAEGTLPTELEVLQEGEWKDMPGRPDFEITASDIDEYAANVAKGIRPGIAINVEHDKDPHFGKQAAGWVTGAISRLKANGKKALFVTPDFNKMGSELVSDKRFRFVSAEFVPRSLGGQPDAEGKGMLSNVLKKVTLTNEPLMKDLPAIMASENEGESTSSLTIQLDAPIIKSNEGNTSVNLDSLRGKGKTELSASELAFVTEHKDELSAAEQTKFGLVTASEDEGKKGEDVTIKATELAELREKAAKADTLESRIANLETAANKGVQASEELAQTKAGTIVDAHIRRGALKQDQKDKWVGQLVKASEADRKDLEEMLTGLPDGTMLASEHGDNKSNEAGAGALKKLNEEADKIMKASEVDGKPRKDYTAALLEARAANTVLASEADAEAANGERVIA